MNQHVSLSFNCADDQQDDAGLQATNADAAPEAMDADATPEAIWADVTPVAMDAAAPEASEDDTAVSSAATATQATSAMYGADFGLTVSVCDAIKGCVDEILCFYRSRS